MNEERKALARAALLGVPFSKETALEQFKRLTAVFSSGPLAGDESIEQHAAMLWVSFLQDNEQLNEILSEEDRAHLFRLGSPVRVWGV